MATHTSDCAVHNLPAFEPGPCDCGAVVIVLAVAYVVIHLR